MQVSTAWTTLLDQVLPEESKAAVAAEAVPESERPVSNFAVALPEGQPEGRPMLRGELGPKHGPKHGKNEERPHGKHHGEHHGEHNDDDDHEWHHGKHGKGHGKGHGKHGHWHGKHRHHDWSAKDMVRAESVKLLQSCSCACWPAPEDVLSQANVDKIQYPAATSAC